MTKMNAKKAIMQKKKEEMISKKIQERSFELLEKEMKKILQNLKDAYLKEKTQDNVAAEVLRDEYLARKNGILEDWNAKEKLLEQRKVYTDYMILGGEYSLSDLIKEYAIFAKAKKGEIIYPQTAKERGKLLLKLNIEDAIPYFLESNILLSEEERRYLKQVEAWNPRREAT